MYNYTWDVDTGGYLLDTKVTGVIKEVRPVFKDELKLLGFDQQFGWKLPDVDTPLMWAEGRRYIYLGNCIGEAVGGGLYELPTLKGYVNDIEIRQVDVQAMVEKNKVLMAGLVQKTLRFIYETYKTYFRKVDLFYLAFSGGKDSIAVLDLVQRALPHDGFIVVFGDTSMELTETYKAVELAKNKWDTLSWHVAKADFDATESWRKIGHPARNLRWCCSVHKTAPSILKVKEILSFQTKGNANFKVMVFDGIRAEESDARASYSMVSEGKKHAVQFNCSPILEWNTSELFLYMLENELFINQLYKVGATRVGCKLCPMASNWYECILNHVYPQEVSPLLEVLYETIKKDFKLESEKNRYFQDGGWKSRIGGRELAIGENKITEINSDGSNKFVIRNANYNWKKWLPTIGDLIEYGNERYSIEYKDVNLQFEAIEDGKTTTLILKPLLKTKSSIRFMYLLKNALNKAAYCVNCKACMVECQFNALKITDNDISIKNCKHCESCLDLRKGCVVAKSLGISGGGNNMSIKNISRYQNFGFRQEWLELYFELRDEFWINERMGKYMLIGFKTWLKESGITENNALTSFGEKLSLIGSSSSNTWASIFTNLAYESPIINWYVKNTEFFRAYRSDDLAILLGDTYSPTTKSNALSSLKETLRFSPIGWLLGQGECELKGKAVKSITRHGWSDPEPLAILYSLYKFAERSDHFYSFTVSDLFDEAEREGISPAKLYNLDRDTCNHIIEGLARDYSDFIRVNFNKDMMEDVYLVSEKTSLDVVSLY
ncbi:hypothetical protein JCM17380_45320 [Desulfosporosinus burensis]